MSVLIRDTSGQDSPIENTQWKWRITKYLIVIFVVVMLLIVVVSQFHSFFSSGRVLDRDTLRLATVRRGDLQRDITAQGRVVASNSPTLYAMEVGTVELRVKAGEQVEIGQILAVLESPALEELFKQERSNLERLKTELDRKRIQNRLRKLALQQAEEVAQVNLKAMGREQRRAEQAHELRLISEFDYEQAVDNFSRAKLQFSQAKQNNTFENDSLKFEERALQLEIDSQTTFVEGLLRRIDALTIKSPVQGMVGAVKIEPFQAVVANQAILSVVDLNDFEVEARVSEGYADELLTKMPVTIQVGGQDYMAELSAISPQVINGEVVTRMKFVDKPPVNLRQNQRLSTRIFLKKIDQTLAVASGAFFDNFRGSVFKVENDRAIRVNVDLGARSLREIQILSGLDEGDTIIVSTFDNQPDENSFLVN